MKLVMPLLFLCLLVYRPIITKAKYRVPRPSPQKNPPSLQHNPPSPPLAAYHHTQFVLSWQPTYCMSDEITCDPKLEKQFYTHGIWPADSNGISMSHCTGLDHEMDDSKFNSIFSKGEQDKIAKYWRSLKKNPNHVKFWTHEWREHGVCSSHILPPRPYFLKGVTLRQNIDLLSYLGKASIFPGKDDYSREAIKSAIQDALDPSITVKITCKSYKSIVYLHEVYICMDPLAVHYVNCPNYPDNCGPFKIKLPLS